MSLKTFYTTRFLWEKKYEHLRERISNITYFFFAFILFRNLLWRCTQLVVTDEDYRFYGFFQNVTRRSIFLLTSIRIIRIAYFYILYRIRKMKLKCKLEDLQTSHVFMRGYLEFKSEQRAAYRPIQRWLYSKDE